MKLAALFSGAKDSTFAMYTAMKQGHEIACLISFIPENAESYMFHTPNIEVTEKQAEALEIPYESFKIKGKKEIEVEDMKRALKQVKEKYDIDGITVGAIASNYQRERVERVCSELKIEMFAPLWHTEEEKYLNELVSEGFKVQIIGVFAEGLDESWLGRKIESETISDLLELRKKYGISIVGEGGEFETFVTDGPIFKKSVEIIDSEKVWENNSGHLKIKKVKEK